MNKDISIVVPIRKGSERVLNKNIKSFTPDGKSLTKLKIDELLKIDNIKEIIITTNYEEIIEEIKTIKSNKIKIDIRPEHLCLSTTKLKDLISYIPTITTAKHILWTHVTSPFVFSEDYQNSIKEYFLALENGFDSLMSVTEHKTFLWSKEERKIINTDDTVNKWPNTQNLKALYEINSAIFINSRENYINMNDRIGDNPYLYILENEKTIDIDWEKDFIFAQKVYKALGSDND